MKSANVKLKEKTKGMKGRVRFIIEDVVTGEIERSPWTWNIIPDAGRTAIARRLANVGSKANEGIITYGAVGTGTTYPQNSDTQLAVELDRKLCSRRTNTLNVITVRTYFTTEEANGDLKEFGLFGEDADGTANSGTLFERVLINRTKTIAKTLTIESEITIL